MFFVLQGSKRALLGMPDIQTVGVLTINHDTLGRQLASDESTDKRKTNRQSKRAVQTQGQKPESWKNKMYDVDVQIWFNANCTAEPGVDANLTVMGKNNNSHLMQVSHSVGIIVASCYNNSNKSFLSE